MFGKLNTVAPQARVYVLVSSQGSGRSIQYNIFTDLSFALQNVNFGIQNGCNLSRARILRFRHNDVADLQRVLESVASEDRHNKCARLTLHVIQSGEHIIGACCNCTSFGGMVFPTLLCYCIPYTVFSVGYALNFSVVGCRCRPYCSG